MIDYCLVSFAGHGEAIRIIRHQVFTLEQKVDPDIDFDGQDNDALHAVAFDNTVPVGTGRLLPDGHIGRIAVLADFRGRGIGTGIMSSLIARARQDDYDRVFLGSQVGAVPFYEKLGFTACGENFMEANILHKPMELVLADR